MAFGAEPFLNIGRTIRRASAFLVSGQCVIDPLSFWRDCARRVYDSRFQTAPNLFAATFEACIIGAVPVAVEIWPDFPKRARLML